MTEEGTKARAALALAIKDAAAANAVAEKARDAVTAASATLRDAEHDQQAARTALERARGVQKPISELLAEARSDDERWQLVDEQNASKGRQPVTVAVLREARILALDTEDGVYAARAAYEQLQESATSATAAANRANDRRQKAVNEVMRPEAIRLMERVQGLTRDLGEARLVLRFAGANFVNDGDERRQISRMLDLNLSSLFPEEFGFKAEPSAALAAWKAFAEAVPR